MAEWECVVPGNFSLILDQGGILEKASAWKRLIRGTHKDIHLREDIPSPKVKGQARDHKRLNLSLLPSLSCHVRIFELCLGLEVCPIP